MDFVRPARVGAACALVLSLATAAPHASAATGTGSPPSIASTTKALAALQKQLDQATRQATQSGAALVRAAAQSDELRIELDQLAAEQAQAQAALGATAVQLYEAAPPQGLPDLASLTVPTEALQGMTSIGGSVSHQDEATIQQAQSQADRLTALSAGTDKARGALQGRTAAVYAAQDRARALIASLQTQLAGLEKAAKDKAAKAAAEAKLAALAKERAALDAQSQQVTLALSPTLTAAGKSALSRQQPMLNLLAAAGSGYPQGYRPTGQTITGVSSWYGPGFVGRDTASGTPYDPELLTCAMLTVPLGTVVRVTNLAGGRSVDVLVTDRGPYVGNRVIDLSHAAAVAVGNSGLATVRIEILAPA